MIGTRLEKIVRTLSKVTCILSASPRWFFKKSRWPGGECFYRDSGVLGIKQEELICEIRTLQRILKYPQSSQAELAANPLNELKSSLKKTESGHRILTCSPQMCLFCRQAKQPPIRIGHLWPQPQKILEEKTLCHGKAISGTFHYGVGDVTISKFCKNTEIMTSDE